MNVFLGIDAGGSGTTAVAIDLDGQLLGSGRAPAANPQVCSPDQVSSALELAARSALDGTAASVTGGVVGMSGLAATARGEVVKAIASAWDRAGLSCPMRVVGDAVTAFASATSEADGTVIVAGTGAVVAEVRDREITRTVDGLGWLLGDEGSGFWLGLAAARHTARHLSAGRPATRLTDAVTGHLGAHDGEAFVSACYLRPREALAELAPLVCESAADGDADARALAAEAGQRLADSYTTLDPGPGPVVITGGLLTNHTPVRAHLQRALVNRTGTTALIATDAALGGAWLAATRSDGLTAEGAAELHKRLAGDATRGGD
ncbi:N-acetylglucosamine kinase [Stackebrandtia nassauensis]|uniref:ATPase BadF/BadG/BcrA/BcrD type n=1 Tax=Stackebrandtia nassauensis (strain DSM 44728 / CIP 108903 / NRRL B-16338 / NBRC 102104 / LLR-40K-21) TaxID=446470 RepID=D3Q7F7_STANL|nr:BadF/BadG/BcrA/BcrD ATPase family protein [Stackebrandtia nassauensis]ADD42428.1 ATPase BadF/BadG/BcrA/BcrD type [Stackebrandtia nassauensis DSM 44728]